MNRLNIECAKTIEELPVWGGDGMPSHLDVLTVDFQPGNATRYPIAFTYLGRDVFGCSGRVFLVSRGIDIGGSSSGCYVFGDGGGFLSPGYVGQKLGTKSDSCAIVLACVIARVLGRSTGILDESKHTYEIGSCRDWLFAKGWV